MSSGISNLFEIGRSALFTAQRVLAVTGQNIANVNTPGYSKQVASVTEARAQDGPGGQFGTGVLATEIRRQVDSFVQAQLLGSYEDEGRLNSSRTALFQLQGLFSETADAGIGTGLTDFFAALQDVAANPSDSTARTVLLTRATTLTQQLNQRATS